MRVKRKTRKHRGETLTEILVALLVALLVLPLAFQSQTDSLKALHALRRQDVHRYGAQWWFNRLPDAVTEKAVDEMPDQTPDGSVSFSFTSESTTKNEDGAIKIILTVRAGSSGDPFVVTRTF